MVAHVEVLTTAGCPHAEAAVERVREVLQRLAPDATLAVSRIEDPEEAARLGFPGSPTVRVDGVDLEEGLRPAGGATSAAPEGPAGPGGPGGPEADRRGPHCRLYDGSGIPPVWLVEAALRRGLAPRHVLFLCVANSARSQMAEGIGRALAPPEVRVSSAGSEPSRIRPEAVEALAEVGIDASGQRSKGVAEVVEAAGRPVDLVVTLCAEEVCPLWLRPAHRVHWAFPDPAAVEGGEGRREAFRRVRDELGRRLGALFWTPRPQPTPPG